MRLVVEVVAADADGSTTSDSGWSQSSGDCEGWRDSDFVMGRESGREGRRAEGIDCGGCGWESGTSFSVDPCPVLPIGRTPVLRRTCPAQIRQFIGRRLVLSRLAYVLSRPSSILAQGPVINV